MTLQQLKYMIAVTEVGSITEAARRLFIPQPSLSGAIKEVEREVGMSIFTRCRAGIAFAKEGMKFLGYVRQVVQQMGLLELKYISNQPAKQRFCISTQHYTSAVSVFVEFVRHSGQEYFGFILNETQAHQTITDVKDRFNDIGILCFNNGNENVLQKSLEGNDLVLCELFAASSHMLLRKDHPLANQNLLRLKDLQPYPKLSFVQGSCESACFAGELFGNGPAEKSIKVSDRAAIVNFMIGLDGYTISGGISLKYLQGDNIISTPLDEDEMMRTGYILSEDTELTELGEVYINVLKKYRPQ